MSQALLAYLDSSAFIKLLASEPESQALDAELGNWPRLVSSELLEIEAKRFMERYDQTLRATISSMLEYVTLIPINPSIRDLACSVQPTELRSLDAIHLATAMILEKDLGRFFAYDRRLVAAAQANQLRTASPA